ncbi:retrotransposon protein, putative, ty1-copia subclass [Tanacetum coccineum]
MVIRNSLCGGRSFWTIPLNDADISWGWRKLLQIWDLVRPYIWTKHGNGNRASAWYDIWDPQGPLIKWISPRDISREGFTLASMVSDLFLNFGGVWPQEWLRKAHNIGLIQMPNLLSGLVDSHYWCDINGNMKPFSVKCAWGAFRPRGNEVEWYHTVWMLVRHLADMDTISPLFQDILLYIHPITKKRTAKSVFGKLIMAATSYYIWIERNKRLFKNVKRSLEELRDLIMVTVRLKIMTFRFKNTTNALRLLERWKMPRNFRLYGFLRRQSHPYIWLVDIMAWKLDRANRQPALALDLTGIEETGYLYKMDEDLCQSIEGEIVALLSTLPSNDQADILADRMNGEFKVS